MMNIKNRLYIFGYDLIKKENKYALVDCRGNMEFITLEDAETRVLEFERQVMEMDGEIINEDYINSDVFNSITG